MYLASRKETVNLALQKKKNYVANKLNSSSKSLYAVVNQLIDNNKNDTVLPKSSSDKELADKFLMFFKEKIEKIRLSFKTSEYETPLSLQGDDFTGEILCSFDPTTEEEIRKIISTHGIKCSPEDPVPFKLLSDHIDVFIQFWVEIVNLSLEYGDMNGLKLAILLPLIKELSSLIDTENFKNYRPVSNLLIISKIVKRAVQIRLERHMVKK